MGGLGLGAWGGDILESTRPIETYARLELFVGIWALFFPLLLSVLGPTFSGNSGVSLLLLSIPLLLPPAFAHGATLPVLAKVTDSADDTGGLYAVNTLGAMCGVLVLPSS